MTNTKTRVVAIVTTLPDLADMLLAAVRQNINVVAIVTALACE